MCGPKAPKNPEKKRSFFYIMKQKNIYGAKTLDGTGIQYLHQSDGRLENSAEIVGNITDKEMLELLGSVTGFRKLVHSIGVAVEMENPSDNVTFIFQMYGKTDLYGGGTNLELNLKGDGSEGRIYLSEADWKPDDNVPGQIKILMDEPDKTGNVSVRFYLNDGFVAPEQEEEAAVDVDGQLYKEMIAKSLIQKGNTYRINKLIEKAQKGEDVTIAYIGGSITQGAGATPINTECYAYKSFYRIKSLLGDGDNIHFVKAGVGGTPSELGMIRFDKDVLRGKAVDAVIVEFAVNDEGDETKGNCYESLVRKILMLPNAPAVILLFSVFANDFNLEERLSPVGKLYDLPMVSIKKAVTEQFYKKEDRVLTKNQFFYDTFHPSNLGHTIMSDCISYLFEQIMSDNENISGGKSDSDGIENDIKPVASTKPVIGNSFDEIKMMDRAHGYNKASISEGDFKEVDTSLQSVEMDESLEMVPEFPDNWMYDGTTSGNGKSFEMEIECKSLVLVFKDSGEVDTAKAKAYVDGKMVRELDPYENGWIHCNPVILFDEKESRNHRVEVVVDEEYRDKKFTILGFGYVE